VDEFLRELFVGHDLAISRQIFAFRYESARHWLEVFRTYYGPTNRAFASLNAGQQSLLEQDILTLLEQSNRSSGGGLVIPGEYLEVVVTKR
jgi:hypothetical protein